MCISEHAGAELYIDAGCGQSHATAYSNFDDFLSPHSSPMGVASPRS